MGVVTSRVEPKMRPEFYKSYVWAAPLGTHWRPASCEEYECAAFLYGWVTVVDITTDLGQRQADFIRHDKTRHATEYKSGDALIEFTFRPGQEAFKGTDEHDHRVPVGKPPLLLVRGGDYRGNPRGDRMAHRNMEDFIDDMKSHQERLAKAQS